VDRRALLTGVATACAALAFALGAAAFGPTVPAAGDAVGDGGGPSEPAEEDHASSPPAASPAAGSDDGGERGGSLGSLLDVRSRVAVLLPGVDWWLLVGALALAVGGLAGLGLRSGEADPAPGPERTDAPLEERNAGEVASEETGVQLDAPPTNDVFRAWRALADRTDVPRPSSTTPREYARHAVAADLPGEAVEGLTRLFERVRYGDAEATEEREERARETAACLDGVTPPEGTAHSPDRGGP